MSDIKITQLRTAEEGTAISVEITGIDCESGSLIKTVLDSLMQIEGKPMND